MSNAFPLHSDKIDEIAAALAKAQGQMGHASKDATNPHFKNDYATLASVIAAAKEPLSSNGIAVVQTTTEFDRELFVITTLAHSSGQWFRSYTPVLMAKQDAQGMGSGLSYTRRYSYQAMVGLAQADDDGEAAVTTPSKDSKGANTASVAGSTADVENKSKIRTTGPAAMAATAAGAKLPKWPFDYPEGLKGTSMSEFATDELLKAEQSLSRWKQNYSEGRGRKFPADGDKYIEALRRRMRAPSSAPEAS